MVRIRAQTSSVVTIAVIELGGIGSVRVVRTFIAIGTAILAIRIINSVWFVGASCSIWVVYAIDIVGAGRLGNVRGHIQASGYCKEY